MILNSHSRILFLAFGILLKITMEFGGLSHQILNNHTVRETQHFKI